MVVPGMSRQTRVRSTSCTRVGQTPGALLFLARRSVMSAAALLALVGCGHITPAPDPRGAPAFGPDGAARPEQALADSPWLRERALASAYAYFRFVNATFVGEVCRRLQPQLAQAQRVNLHGDAHLEQFAVTDAGRGLNDFDDSVRGPAAIDLVRFTTSLQLSTRARGWPVDAALDAFFAGYRTALADPTFRAPQPAIVARVRARFDADPAKYFALVERLMEPIPAENEARLRRAMVPYVEAIHAADPGLAASTFQIRSVGRTRVGIGSARAHKYLVRIEGATSSADDDVVLEVKEVGDVPEGTCVERGNARDPLRPIVGQARIGYEPYRFAGYLTYDDAPYWVHAWERNYCELSASQFDSVEELVETSFDAGVQLGLGHPRYIAAPFESETRARELSAIGTLEAAVRLLSRQLADEVTASWRRAVAG